MRPLQLDFQRRPRASAFGWLLLLAAGVTLAGLLQAHNVLAQQAAAHAATLHRIQVKLPAIDPAPRQSGAHNDAALLTARQVIEQSKLPWNGLFAALESADGQDVALLAVTPDVLRHRVKIHAEARDLAAMLVFYRHLQQSDGMAQVVLVDHAVSKETAEAPVRFHVYAVWGGNHDSP